MSLDQAGPGPTQRTGPPRRAVLVGFGTAPLAAAAVIGAAAELAGPDAWTRALLLGASGSDVAELQVRVAGWGSVSGSGPLAVDGRFGPRTLRAVGRFQSAHGLVRDGRVAIRTQAVLDALVRADGGTAHFGLHELASGTVRGFTGGAVPEAVARENGRWVLHRLEALRHKCGGGPVSVLAGFRAVVEDRAVGGPVGAGHADGSAADIAVGDLPTAAVRAVALGCGFGAVGAVTGPWLHLALGRAPAP